MPLFLFVKNVNTNFKKSVWFSTLDILGQKPYTERVGAGLFKG